MGGLPFNRAGDNPTPAVQTALANQRHQMMRQASMRNMSPVQLAAATAASGPSPANANMPNANMPNAMGMGGANLVQRQAQQQASQLNANMNQQTPNHAALMGGKKKRFSPQFCCFWIHLS